MNLGLLISGPSIDDPNVTFPEEQEWFQRFQRKEFAGTQNNASFKTIPFIIDGDDATFGRRVVIHEYPNRDIPYAEDLGRSARQFSVNGILLGDDYLTQRDRLVGVCEADGAGELIHPYYGILNVICNRIQITNVRRESRIATFQALFIETGKFSFPSVTSDTRAAVNSQFNMSLLDKKSAFVSAYGTIKRQVIYLEGVKAVDRKSVV